MKSKAFTYVARLLLVLFVVANAGFTRVIQTCSMPDMGCCGDNSADMNCPEHAPITGQATLAAGADCMTRATLGGLADTHAVEVKTLKTMKQQGIEPLPVDLYTIPSFTHDRNGVEIALAHHVPYPLTSSPRYILNLSLLI